MDRPDALARARAWWSAVSDTGLVPVSADDLQSRFADLVVELSNALDAEDFGPARPALFTKRLTNPATLARSAEALGAAVHNAFAIARKVAADALHTKNTRFKVVFENAAVAIGVSDTDGRLIEANPALAAMVGRQVDELPGTLIYDLVHPDDWERVHDAVHAELVENGGRTARVEVRYRQGADAYGWAMFAITYVPGAGEVESYVLAVGEDITERRDMQSELYHQARHDPLTGLANRALLLETIQDAIATSAPGDRIGLCFIDLDGFKAVNDRYGHGVGDKLLAAVAGRLATCSAELGTQLARIGGDEFVAVAAAPADIATVLNAAENYLGALADPFTIGEHSVAITASIGVLAPVVHDATPDALLDAVDAALYRAKADGGGVVYLPDGER